MLQQHNLVKSTNIQPIGFDAQLPFWGFSQKKCLVGILGSVRKGFVWGDFSLGWFFTLNVPGKLCGSACTITSPRVAVAIWQYKKIRVVRCAPISHNLRYIADIPARTRLRSSSTSLLDVRPSRRVTAGDRSFATAGPRIWNTLPRDVTTATSLLSFRRKLKTHLFRQSYPDIVVWLAP